MTASTIVTVYPASAWPSLIATWRDLVSRSTAASFFLSAEWAEAWMGAFGGRLKPDILVFSAGGRAVGACMLVRRLERAGPVPLSRVYLNMAGEDEIEDTTIEYNDVLCADGWAPAIAVSLAGHLSAARWDEFVAGGVTEGGCVEAALARLAQDLEVTSRARTSWYVGLGAVRASGGDLAAAIGDRSRKNLRRYFNLYSADGPIETAVPGDAAQALELLDELIALHQATWRARGRPGAFASPRVAELHRELVSRTFDQGLTQLLRVSAGDRVIGLVYNFVFRGKVYAYQQGLHYDGDGRRHPGYVTTASAVSHCLDAGLDEYDHLVGDQIDKRALSTGHRTLTWSVCRRATPANAAVRWLKRVRALARPGRE